jgi:hypothetical protein
LLVKVLKTLLSKTVFYLHTGTPSGQFPAGVFLWYPLMKKQFLLLLTIMFCITVCHAEELNAVRKDNVAIIYDNGLENAAVSAGQIYPDIRQRLEKTIGWECDFYPSIYLVKDHEHFIRMSGHPLVVGYAVPDKLLIVIDYSKMLSDPFSISSIMKHELCHLLLHRNIQKKNLPTWLDEGVSQMVSGGLADIEIADYSAIDRAIVTGRLIPFKYLSGNFPGDNVSLMLAYAQSKSLVEYIAKEFKPDGIQNLLNSLRRGNDIENAVHGTFLISFDELEKNWYSSLKKKATWITLLINHLYEIIFFLGALALIAAYIKLLIRKRSGDDEDDIDEHEPPLGF